MSINKPYLGPEELPALIPVFPLAGVLMLPRGQLPLNIFEPRYIAMVDDALKSHRLIGMIQPAAAASPTTAATDLESVGCVGRITQFAETGDGRYTLALTGVCRFRLVEELSVVTPYRQCRVSYDTFANDFILRADDDGVDRDSVIRALRAFADCRRLRIDWDEINRAPNEVLVNALSMMSPFGASEKQALLEAVNLKARAEVLVAITELELAKGAGTNTTLQ